MNKLKFRVWDKKHKFYVWDRSVYLSGDGELEVFNCKTRNKDYFVIQQFTGKIDIVGTEIYEGDICEMHMSANDKSNVKEQYGVYVVYRGDNGEFKIKTIKKNWFHCFGDNAMIYDFNILKVIGNIFENKKLLK